MQSFTLWQQANMEITQLDHSIVACSRHILCVALCAHLVHGESYFQCNAERLLATTSPPFSNEQQLSHVLFVKVAPMGVGRGAWGPCPSGFQKFQQKKDCFLDF